MEIRHRIIAFSNSPEKFKLLEQQFNKYGCDYQLTDLGGLDSIEFTFSENESFVSELLLLAKTHDITVQSGLHYDEEEILKAEWVILQVGEFQYPQPEDEYIYETYNTEYYCSQCGQGAVQDRPFQLKKDFAQKRAHFLGLHWVFDEIFVRPIVRRLFDTENISGIGYREVLHHRTKEPFQNLFQLEISQIPERALMTEDLNILTCKPNNEEGWNSGDVSGLIFCGRVKYRWPRTKPIKFKASALQGLPDIVKSQEYYGSGAAAFHFMLARNKVVKLASEKGLRGLSAWRPVHLV